MTDLFFVIPGKVAHADADADRTPLFTEGEAVAYAQSLLRQRTGAMLGEKTTSPMYVVKVVKVVEIVAAPIEVRKLHIDDVAQWRAKKK